MAAGVMAAAINRRRLRETGATVMRRTIQHRADVSIEDLGRAVTVGFAKARTASARAYGNEQEIAAALANERRLGIRPKHRADGPADDAQEQPTLFARIELAHYLEGKGENSIRRVMAMSLSQ